MPRSPFGIHWVQGTTSTPADELLADFAEHFGQDTWEARGRGRFGYRESFVSVAGIEVHTKPSTESMPESLVIVPGGACESVGWDRLRWLAMWGLKLTRVDLAFDHGDVAPRTFRRYWEAGRARSRVHRDSFAWHENAEGATFTLGKRSGTRYLRVYDRRGFPRVELELRKERAQAFLGRGGFLGSLADARRLGLGFLRDMVDFVDSSAGRNPSRWPILPWWREWLGGAERANAAMPPRAPTTLAGSMQWMRDQVAVPLARVAYAFGQGAVDELVAVGKARLGPRLLLPRLQDEARRMRSALRASAAAARAGAPGSAHWSREGVVPVWQARQRRFFGEDDLVKNQARALWGNLPALAPLGGT